MVKKADQAQRNWAACIQGIGMPWIKISSCPLPWSVSGGPFQLLAAPVGNTTAIRGCGLVWNVCSTNTEPAPPSSTWENLLL